MVELELVTPDVLSLELDVGRLVVAELVVLSWKSLRPILTLIVISRYCNVHARPRAVLTITAVRTVGRIRMKLRPSPRSALIEVRQVPV